MLVKMKREREREKQQRVKSLAGSAVLVLLFPA